MRRQNMKKLLIE